MTVTPGIPTPTPAPTVASAPAPGAGGSAAGSAPTGGPGTQSFRSGGGRRLVLAFAFLLLLPFYASLGPMLYQRLSRGLVMDSAALGVFALIFTAVMGMILQQLIHAVRTRVVIDTKAVAMTVPAVGNRGPLFLWRYTTREIPFAEVTGVETRSEVYGGSLAPVMLTSTRVLTKDGQNVVLGYTNANDSDDQIPYPTIGAEIATRAGTKVVDRGVVHRSLQQRVLGLASTAGDSASMSAADIAVLNGAHRRNVRLLVGALVVLVVGGIAVDFLGSSQAAHSEMGAGLSNPARGATPKQR